MGGIDVSLSLVFVSGGIKMYNELTEDDIKKMEEEIEYRRVVLRCIMN